MRQGSPRARQGALKELKRQVSADGFGALQTELIEAIYRTHVRPGDTVLDLGAHLGFHVVRLAECVGPGGHVHAVEALPASCRQLRAGMARAGLADRVTVWERALAREPGEAQFTLVEGAPGRSGLVARPELLKDGVAFKTLSVVADTLDNLFASETNVRFVKANLQGGEFDAFAGGAALLQAARPILVFENGRQAAATLYGYDAAAFFGLFDSLGYDLFDVLGYAFTPDDWMAGGLPWWFIGVPRARKTFQGSIQGAIDAHLDARGLEPIVAMA